MLVIQALIALFCVFALVRAAMQFHAGRLTRRWFGFWMLFWLAVAVAVALPQTTQMFARLLGVGRGVDAAIYVSILLLFYLVYRLFVKLEDLEHELTTLVRKGALEGWKKEKDGKN